MFADSGTNLVTGDGNGSVDVFVKDRTSNATTRVSVASDGTERTGDSGVTGVDVSGDGQIVVFTSKAALVPGDTNTCGDPVGPCQDIYLHDRGTGQTTRVSVATGGTQANGPSDWPNISRNGRYVTFTSHATNLVATDTNARVGHLRPRSRDGHHHARQRVYGRHAGRLGTAQRQIAHQRGRYHRRVHVVGTADGRTGSVRLRRGRVSSRVRARPHGGYTVRVPLTVETQIQDIPPPVNERRATLEEIRLDASGRRVALVVIDGSPTHFGTKLVSQVYDRVTGRTLDPRRSDQASPLVLQPSRSAATAP